MRNRRPSIDIIELGCALMEQFDFKAALLLSLSEDPRANSSSSHSSAASDQRDQDKIVDQCIVGGTANLSCIEFKGSDFPSSSKKSCRSEESFFFGKDYDLERHYVSDLVMNYVVPKLISSKVIATLAATYFFAD